MKVVQTSRVSVLVAICLLTVPALAQYGGGTGGEYTPYLIYTAEQMNEIGLHDEHLDKHFKLMADIDLSVCAGFSGTPGRRMRLSLSFGMAHTLLPGRAVKTAFAIHCFILH